MSRSPNVQLPADISATVIKHIKWSLQSVSKKHIRTTSVTMTRDDSLCNIVCKLNPELVTAGFTAWVTAGGVARPQQLGKQGNRLPNRREWSGKYPRSTTAQTGRRGESSLRLGWLIGGDTLSSDLIYRCWGWTWRSKVKIKDVACRLFVFSVLKRQRAKLKEEKNTRKQIKVRTLQGSILSKKCAFNSTVHPLKGLLETVQLRHGLTFCSVGEGLQNRTKDAYTPHFPKISVGEGQRAPLALDNGPAGATWRQSRHTVRVKSPEFEPVPLWTWLRPRETTGHSLPDW